MPLLNQAPRSHWAIDKFGLAPINLLLEIAKAPQLHGATQGAEGTETKGMPRPKDFAEFNRCIGMFEEAQYSELHILDQAANIHRPLVKSSKLEARGLRCFAVSARVCQAHECVGVFNDTRLWESGRARSGKSTARPSHLGVHIHHRASRIMSHGGGEQWMASCLL